MADVTPALPSSEDGIQEIACKAKGKWLIQNQDAETRARSWVGTAWKERQGNCISFLLLCFAQITTITQMTTNLMAQNNAHLYEVSLGEKSKHGLIRFSARSPTSRKLRCWPGCLPFWSSGSFSQPTWLLAELHTLWLQKWYFFFLAGQKPGAILSSCCSLPHGPLYNRVVFFFLEVIKGEHVFDVLPSLKRLLFTSGSPRITSL